MSSGTYDISFKKDHYSFMSLDNFKVSPINSKIPNIILSGVDICGNINIDKSYFDINKISKDDILLELKQSTSNNNSDNNGNIIATTNIISNENDDNFGDFCFLNIPTNIEYIIYPVIRGSTLNNNDINFEPKERKVNVLNEPLFNQNFEQLKFKIIGSINYIDDIINNDNTKINLISKTNSNFDRIGNIINEQEFIIENILPGEYSINIEHLNWCWKDTHKDIKIINNDIDNIIFEQIGYELILNSSHKIDISYYLNNNNNNNNDEKKSFVINNGLNTICLPNSGEYIFTPESCYKFENENYRWSTKDIDNILNINVINYPVKGYIYIQNNNNNQDNIESNINVKILTSSSNDNEIFVPINLIDSSYDNNNYSLYSYTYWGNIGDKIIIKPEILSNINLLFYPSTQEYIINNNNNDNICDINVKEEFYGRSGIFISGTIEPEPIPGVEITVKVKNSNEIIMKGISDNNGKYSIGPLYDNIEYITEANLDGYYFTSNNNNNNNNNGFKAVELSQITLEIIDQYNEKIPGVLLSLTGESTSSMFFKDTESNENGIGYFDELFPGVYYLRPQLKEYMFTPTNIPINLEEGINHKLTINGKRVAFSAYGNIKSLSGDSERGVSIIAKSINNNDDNNNNNSIHIEETQSDSKGDYRLRGLKPNSKYLISINTENSKIERSSPNEIEIDVKEEDIKNLNFIGFRKNNRYDIIGNINILNYNELLSNYNEILDSLSLELYVLNKKQNNIELVKTISFGKYFNSFEFTQLPKEEYTLKLLSSLNSNQYESFNLPTIDIDFNLIDQEQEQLSSNYENGRYFISLNFNPILKSDDTQIIDVSFYPLIIISILFFGFWYRKLIHHHYKKHSTSSSSKLNASSKQQNSNHSEWLPNNVTKHAASMKRRNNK